MHVSDDYPWLKHYPEEIDWHAPLPAKPLYFLLDEAAYRFGEHTALEFFGKTYSYNHLKQMTDRLARGLQAMGVKQGTKVGLFLPNCPQFVMAYYAILKIGAIVVNFNPLYSQHEVEHQINDADVEVIFTINLKNIYPKLTPFLTGTSLRKIVMCQFQEAMPIAKAALFLAAKATQIVRTPKDTKHISFNELCDHDNLVVCPKVNPETDIAVLQYTGGTTGVPKGASLTHANLYVNALQCSRWMHGLEPGNETLLAVLPFFHVFAMTVALNMAIANGFKIIIHPRFDLKQVLGDIDKKRPTIMPGVSTLYATIGNYPKIDRYDLTSIKMCISGGGPLPLEVKERFERITGCALVEGYGLTEASPVTSCNPLFGKQKKGSIGLPLPQTIMEIIDKDDQKTILRPGEIGEICISGPQVMQGYYNNPEATAQVLKNGRLHTGDLGYMDEEGYFTIVDRLKEMIIVGGYNVYPRNVEEELYAHEAIAEAAVVGLDHHRRGQMIKAYVVLKEGKTINENDLKTYLRTKMSAYAVPHAIEFRDELPKSPIGKILKKELIAEEKRKKEAAKAAEPTKTP
jgi:long-chain acyl-CoA synthetase